MTRNGRGKHHILRPRPYSFCSGGFSLLPSSVLSARITSCTCASNFCVSCSHPVKSAATRDSTGLALPLVHFPQQIPVQVQRNHRQHFSLALFHQFAFFGKRAINLIVHPPARQRVPRATQQHLVPQPNPAVYLFVNVIARQHLLLIQPAPHAPSLQRIMQPPREELVRVGVADEARVILNRTSHYRPDVGNKLLRHPTSAQKNLGYLALRLNNSFQSESRRTPVRAAI